VENVSYGEAVLFCNNLTALAAEKRNGRTYRLPTEAEWEYACRGGRASQVFHFGDSLSSKQANFRGTIPYGGAAKGDYLARTTWVGSYTKNPFGLYDMHGNVLEWCADWYAKDYGPNRSRDPVGPAGGSDRVFRGGCWGTFGQHCRSARRVWSTPAFRFNILGFRVALVPSR
jgi:formylglycine-generating enzyme required for sulfatase activity